MSAGNYSGVVIGSLPSRDRVFYRVGKLLDQLKTNIKGKVVVLGIGNTLKGDDGLGPELVERLKGRVNAEIYNGSTVPENFLRPILNTRPDTVLLVDAVLFDEAPGTLKLFNPEGIPENGFSTHNVSPKLFIALLRQETSANIFLLGVQPKSLEFGQGISDEVTKTLEGLEVMLIAILSNF